MRTGELAERAGISAEAIRYYERVGVLTPPARTASGYRDYDEVALDRLSFVRAAQAVGLTLGQIREVVAFRDWGGAPLCVGAGADPTPVRRAGGARRRDGADQG